MTADPEINRLKHIAIIMDGNNRWARARGLSARVGHREGAAAAKRIVFDCVRRKIPYLTLFAFSSENWSRPASEVFSLMALFVLVLKRKEIQELHEANVKIQIVGNRSAFSKRLRSSIERAEKLTENNTGTTVIVAADYGGRWDITQAVQGLARDVEQGVLHWQDIDVATVHARTSLAAVPEPDLCIRTGGERRLSNFLLWQFAYTELFFSECYWPDFNEQEFDQALRDYSFRQRRFGGHDLELVKS